MIRPDEEPNLSLDVWSDRNDIGQVELPQLQRDCLQVWNCSSADPDQVSLGIQLFLQWVWPPMTDQRKAESLKDLLTGIGNMMKMLKARIQGGGNGGNGGNGEKLESLLERFAHTVSLIDPVVRDCPDSGAAVLVATMPGIYLLSFQTCLSISDSCCSPLVESGVKNLFNASQAQLANFLKVTQAMEEDDLLLDYETSLIGFNAILELAQVLIVLRFKHFAMAANWIRDFLALKHEKRIPAAFVKKARISKYVNFLAAQSSILTSKLATKLTAADCKKLSFLLEHITTLLSQVDEDYESQQHQQLNCGRIVELLGSLIRLVSFDTSVSQGVLERKLISTVPKKVEDFLDLMMTREDFSDYLLGDPEDEEEEEVSGSLSICLVQSEILRKLQAQDEYAIGGDGLKGPPWFASEERNLFRSILNRAQTCSRQESKDTSFLCKDSPVTLPGIQIPGKPVTPVTPYEHILSRLQAFCVGATREAFEMIEVNLFDIVMRNASKPGPHHWSMKMSADILCFLARYAGPEICRSHVKFLVEIFQEEPKGFPPNLRLLLERLGRLLAKNDLEDIEIKYSPNTNEAHLMLLSIMDPSKFSPPFQQTVLKLSLSLCFDFASGSLDISRMQLLPAAMRLLCKLWYLAESKWTSNSIFMLWQKMGGSFGITTWSLELMTELYHLAKVSKIDPETQQPSMKGGNLIQLMALATKNCSYQDHAVYLLVNYIENRLSHDHCTGSFQTEAVKILIRCLENVDEKGLSALKIITTVARCSDIQSSAAAAAKPHLGRIQRFVESGHDIISFENFSPIEWVMENEDRSKALSRGNSEVGAAARSSKDRMNRILDGALDRALQIEDPVGEVKNIIDQLTKLKNKLNHLIQNGSKLSFEENA